MKRSLVACLFLLPGCNPPEPPDEGADEVESSQSVGETSESTGESDGDGDGDGDGDATTGDGDGDTSTSDGGTTTTTTTDEGETTTGETETTGEGDTTGGGLCPPLDDCDQLADAFDAETQKIRSCTEDAQCGQILQDTSCGCTRDWVARLDADLTCFHSLMAQADEMQCDLDFSDKCDCPDADGFACEDDVCTWNYL